MATVIVINGTEVDSRIISEALRAFGQNLQGYPDQ
jgi:hypothetical protein